MSINIESLVELLNKDLELEYAAAIQFINHAAVMNGAVYGDIIKQLKLHAAEEMQHAITLARQINYLGGKPSVGVGVVYVSNNDAIMLKQDLMVEEDAIKRYKERIAQAEQLKEFTLSQQLRAILAMEQEHAMDLGLALGKKSTFHPRTEGLRPTKVSGIFVNKAKTGRTLNPELRAV
jgi:bacterioferritin